MFTTQFLVHSFTMRNFCLRLCFVIINIVFSDCLGLFSGYGQYSYSHGHKYQTSFPPSNGDDDVVAGVATHDVYQYDHHPYHYSYGYSVYGPGLYGGAGPRFDKTESRIGGVTEGGYTVDLPDGRTQIVSYTVRGDQGYVAKVSYVPTKYL